MPDLVPVQRAILSVSDKADLVPFARALASLGVEIISTGGTARALVQAGIPVTPIDAVTGFPEMMDGRVKTLHPMVHGALLGVRDNPAHAEAMRRFGIRPIDLVAVDLYPFERTAADPARAEADAIELIDIGGPSMIRSAAKNFEWVAVVTSPTQYDRVTAELSSHRGATTRRLRFELASSAFARTSAYDAAIAAYLGRGAGGGFPPALRLEYAKVEDLRYGENPHQRAALYRAAAGGDAGVVGARQLHGKALSYNNLNDASAALELVRALHVLDPARAACVVVKHANPCGAAAGASPRDAVEGAIAGDPVAAYGGILALSAPVDAAAAERLCRDDVFMEVIVAPGYDPAALGALRERWANVRLLAADGVDRSAPPGLEYRFLPGGLLVQDRDSSRPDPSRWTHAAGPAPTPMQLADGAFLECCGRALLSNAIAIGGTDAKGVRRLFGAGAGQVDRVGACRVAVAKAGALAAGAVAYSDAFFPFPDGPAVLIDAGVRVIIHPGGSKRDAETFDLCNGRGVTCLTTGVRRFRH